MLTSLSESNQAPNQLRLEEKGASNERLLAHIKALQSRSVAVEARSGRQRDPPARQDGRSAGERPAAARALAAAAGVDWVLNVADDIGFVIAQITGDG